MLTRTSAQTLTDQLAERFAERIRNRLLAPGARLPSVRECARQQGVSPHTVVAAYDQLLAQGLVEARRQRGFYVRNDAAAPAGRAPAAIKNVAEPVQPVTTVLARAPADASTLIRGMFHRQSAKPQPGMGVLPPDWSRAAMNPRSCSIFLSCSAFKNHPRGDRRPGPTVGRHVERPACHGRAPERGRENPRRRAPPASSATGR